MLVTLVSVFIGRPLAVRRRRRIRASSGGRPPRELAARSGRRVTLLVAQDDIAGLSGAGRPTVNQVLQTMEGAGAIELRRGRIDVVDRAVLARHRG